MSGSKSARWREPVMHVVLKAKPYLIIDAETGETFAAVADGKASASNECASRLDYLGDMSAPDLDELARIRARVSR